MFDLGPLKKALATIDLVRHGSIEQRGFNHTALRIGAVEHGNLLALHVVAHQLLHLVHHPLGFGKVAGGFKHAHRLARALIGAQVFAQTFAVVADEFVGRIQNVAVAAVVLLQLDLVFHAKLAHEVSHIAHPSATKSVNALVIVPHSQHAAGGVETGFFQRGAMRASARQHLDPGILQFVGVLKFVNQDVPEAALVMLTDGVVVAQQLVGTQHQLTEIDHAFTLALLFVQLVDFYLLAGFIITHLNHVGP